MALDAQRLVTGLRDLSNNRPSSIALAAQRWAHAYAGYASQAMALDASPVPNAREATLASNFLASMESKTFLLELPVHLSSFWVIPPVAFVGPTTTGFVTVAAGIPVLAAGIPVFIATNLSGGSSEFPLDPLAALMHAFTLAVIVQLINTATGAPLPTNIL